MKEYLFTAVLILTTSFFAFAQPESKDLRIWGIGISKMESTIKLPFISKNYITGRTVSIFFYSKYYEILVMLEDYDELEKMIRKAYKVKKNEGKYLVDLGYIYSLKGDAKASQNQYQEAIDKMPPKQFEVMSMASKFINYNELNNAQLTYSKGREILNDASLFNFELAQLYSMQGNYQGMITSYLGGIIF